MPGTVTFFGSGETSPTGGRVFETLARQIPLPVRISVLETPAGFELNSERVAGRVTAFLTTRLQNYQPRISQVAARKKGTKWSPDSRELAAPLYESDLIFLGPGSPTYAARQLQNSLVWNILQACHRMGASLVFASAAAVAAGDPALPVYEIYKVGEDPHWKPGLDLCGPFGLHLVMIPHWNNQDGGEELDTSRCFIGRERFESLLAQLTPEKTVLGIDELTTITLDFQSQTCQVAGLGSVHLLRGGSQVDYLSGSQFSINELGGYVPLANLEAGLPADVWQTAQQAARREDESAKEDSGGYDLPMDLQQLVKERETARERRDWSKADELRQQIAARGWKVIDSPEGPQVQPIQ